MADGSRSATRYRVNIDRPRAIQTFQVQRNARGFTGSFNRPQGGQGPGSFKIDQTGGPGVVAADVTMPQARRLHKLGLLTPGDNAFAPERHPRRARHMYAATGIVIDLTDMDRLAVGFHGVAVRIQKGGQIISRAINNGLRRLRTQIRRDLSQWTGLRDQGKIQKSISLAWSSPTHLVGVLRVKSGHTVVTAGYYGASWNRANPGATHKAWNRGQLAVHTFMIPGKKPVFRRLSSQRLPIAPIWGPNLAREVERHEADVQAKVTAIGVVVSREAARLMSVAISQARG